jgi:hypothetical protein
VAESARARSWIWQTLANDTTLANGSPPSTPGIGKRIHNGRAPQGEKFPLVIMQLLSPGNDLIVVGGQRIWSDMLWLVKVVNEGTSTAPIEASADRIDALLHTKNGTVVGGVVHVAVRERPHELPERTDGVDYVNLGGEYRVKASVA